MRRTPRTRIGISGPVLALVAAGIAVGGAAGCVGEVGSPGNSGSAGSGGSGKASGGAGGSGGASSGGGGSTAGSGGGSGNGSGGASGNGSGGSGGASSGTGGDAGATGDPLLPARIRRLTTREYDASVKALLGTTMTMGVSSFPPDSRQGGFTVNDAQRVDPVLAQQLSNAADALVAEARASGKLTSLAPCANATSGGEACAKTFIQSFGAAAYRRPLTSDEVTAFLTVYRVGVDGGAYADGIDLIVRAALQSAGFLYLTEIGDAATPVPGAMVNLTANETATALSYLITSGPPDSAMLTAAGAGELAAPEGREKAARRILQTAPAQDSLVRVVREWLGIDGISATDKDSTVYPDFAAVKDAFATESQSFVREVVLESTGTIGELLGADWTVADAALGKLYGVKPAASGHTSLGATGRRGILNQGAFLSVYAHASESAPVFRGVAVLRRVACMTIQSPIELNIEVTPPMQDPTKTTRDRFAAHVSDPGCASCHNSIDSIGFAFEKYDGMGAARPLTNGAAMENGQPVVTATVLGDKPSEQKTDFDGAYSDSDALAMGLAGSAQVRACFARQLFRSSAGRSDGAAHGAEEAFVSFWKQLPTDQQGNVIETLVAFVKNPGFAQRRAQ